MIYQTTLAWPPISGSIVRPFLFLSLLGSLSCQVQDQPLPTESKVQKLNQADMGSPPPLYQFLYDSAFIPEAQYAEQRTRILVWLRYCDFDEHQLRQLHTLHRRAATLRQRVERTQQEIVQGFELDLIPTYNAIHDMLREGYDLDDPALEQAAQALLETRRHAAREEEILSMRLQSVQALLDEEQEFLRLLTPRQEVYFPDLIFVLRRDLDLAAAELVADLGVQSPELFFAAALLEVECGHGALRVGGLSWRVSDCQEHGSYSAAGVACQGGNRCRG